MWVSEPCPVTIEIAQISAVVEVADVSSYIGTIVHVSGGGRGVVKSVGSGRGDSRQSSAIGYLSEWVGSVRCAYSVEHQLP